MCLDRVHHMAGTIDSFPAPAIGTRLSRTNSFLTFLAGAFAFLGVSFTSEFAQLGGKEADIIGTPWPLCKTGPVKSAIAVMFHA